MVNLRQPLYVQYSHNYNASTYEFRMLLARQNGQEVSRDQQEVWLTQQLEMRRQEVEFQAKDYVAEVRTTVQIYSVLAASAVLCVMRWALDSVLGPAQVWAVAAVVACIAGGLVFVLLSPFTRRAEAAAQKEVRMCMESEQRKVDILRAGLS